MLILLSLISVFYMLFDACVCLLLLRCQSSGGNVYCAPKTNRETRIEYTVGHVVKEFFFNLEKTIGFLFKAILIVAIHQHITEA